MEAYLQPYQAMGQGESKEGQTDEEISPCKKITGKLLKRVCNSLSLVELSRSHVMRISAAEVLAGAWCLRLGLIQMCLQYIVDTSNTYKTTRLACLPLF